MLYFRRSVLVLAVLAVLVAFSAAGTVAQEKLLFWTWWTVDEETLAKMEEYTGYEVEYQQLSWGDVRDKLVVSVAANTGPDVIYVDPAWFDDFVAQKALTDLSPLLERNPDILPLNDIFPTGMELWEVEGKQWAIPNNLSPGLFWYNNTLFKEIGLPKLGDDFDVHQWLDFTRKLTRDTDGDGVMDQYGLMTWWYQICNLIWSYDGHIFKDGTVDPNNPGLIEALSFYKELYDRQLICHYQELMHKGQEDPDKAWSNGFIGFAPGGAWVGPSRVRSGDEWRFDVQVAHQPMSPIGKRAALMRGNGLAIPASSKNKIGALKLIAWIIGDEAQTEMAINGQMPSRASIATSEAFLPEEEYPYSKEVIIEALEYQRGPVKGVKWSVTYEHWNSPIKQAFNDFLNNNATMAEVIDRIKRQVPPLIEGK